MDEITPDMLPDTQPEATPAPQETVREDAKTPVSESPGPEDAPAETEPKVPSGHVPYSRFKEEVQKRKELEEQLQDLQASETPEEEVVEEDNPLSEKVDKLERELYLTRFPDLNDKREELEAFLEEKSTMELSDAVTLFRAEQGMLASPARKGLEKVVAGQKTAPTARFTAEEVESMRMNNPDKWMKLSVEGAFDDIAKW